MSNPAAGEDQLLQGGLSRSGSASRLNARAPEFVPRPPAPVVQQQPPAVIRVFAGPPPPPPASFFVAGPPPPPPPFEYYAAVGGGGAAAAAAAGFGAVLEHEAGLEQLAAPQQVQPHGQQQGREMNPDDLMHKITKQVSCSSW
jgi:La-related protein 7